MDISLEEQEAQIEKDFETNRSRMFKGTIAVSVVYGVIALIFVVLMFLSEKSKQVLGVDFFAFSVTFIAGVLLIITLLVIQIVTFKKEKPKFPMDMYQCPDYWDLTETPESTVQRFPEDVQSYVKYRCTPKATVYDSTQYNTAVPSTSTTGGRIADPQELTTAWSTFNQNVNTSAPDQMSCKQMYPGWMAWYDTTNHTKDPRKMRCQYAKFCKTSATWSDLCKT